MMCASELIAVRNVEIMKLEKAKAESLARSLEASIDFCESVIGPKLEMKARNPKSGSICEYFTLADTFDRYENAVLCPIVFDGRKYANGNLSYSPNDNKCYNKACIEKYLRDHGLSVKWADTTYLRYCYGEVHAYTLIVEAK